MSLVDLSAVPPMLRAGAEDADVEYALTVASAAVESYCERRFAERVDHVVLVSPRPNRTAQLPDAPVSDVSKVEAWMPRNGAMQWVEITNFAFTPDGLLYDTAGLPGVEYSELPTWPGLPQSLRVTYDHGFEDLPESVSVAVIKAAGDFLSNPEGLVRYRVDDVDRQWTNGQGGIAVDCDLLSEYRLKSIP